MSVSEASSCLRIRNELVAFEIGSSKTTYRFELIFVFLMLPLISNVIFVSIADVVVCGGSFCRCVGRQVKLSYENGESTRQLAPMFSSPCLRAH